MPNHLTENDWKTELKKKENKDVKKTGVSEALRDYEKVAKQGGKEAIAALETLVKVADEAKRKHAGLKSLGDYLGEISKQAASRKSQLAQNLPSDDPERDEQVKRLQVVKTITNPERAFNFVCTPGKRTGLYVSKTPITMTDVQAVKDFRGKGRGGPILRGLAYGDSGKLVFDFGEVEPPKGVAKALRKTLKTHFDLQSLKVIAKGAAKSLDDETDVDDVDFENPFEQATGLTDHKAGNRGDVAQGANYVSAEQWQDLLRELQARDAGQRAGMMEGLLGVARRDSELIRNDRTLSPELKKIRAKVIEDAVRQAKQILATPPQRPATTPTSAPQNQTGTQRRREIVEVMGRNLEFVEKAAFAKGGASAIATKPELMAGGGHLGALQKALADCEPGGEVHGSKPVHWTPMAVTPDKLKQVRAACDGFDALCAVAETGFVPGTAAAALARKDLDPGRNFQACAKIFEACEANPTPKNLELLRKACESYLKGNAKDLEKAKPGEVAKIEAKGDIVRGWQLCALKAQDPAAYQAQRAVGMQARTQVRLVEIAAEYKKLGAPDAWTRTQEEIAAELEAAYLFEEGTVSQGANFGAVPLGGSEGGVNAAYWIKRKQPGAKNTDADSLYIFKPGDAEADVVSGLPAGSGAAREVLAKDLADTLRVSGLNVDVCPTDLVSIDGAKLPDADGKPAVGKQRTGAMQRLGGGVKGNIREHLEKDAGLAKRIDKASYDQLAVFDLIIGNLDRHAGNILISGDPATAPKLVPIDHGTSMPGLAALKLNTSRMEHPLNVLMSPELEQGAKPLDPATVKALRSLNPTDIAKTMRDNQARLRQRHGELDAPGMGVDDEQIKIMERTTRFMQAAAEKLTVHELFEAKARHIDAIMKDPEPDWGKLVDEIAAELKDWHAAKQQAGKFVDLDTTSWMSHLNALQALGWCMGMSQAQAKQWATDNADLVVRILGARIENPGLKAEADGLRRELGTTKGVDRIGTNLPLVAQVKQLRELLNRSNLPESLRDPQPIRDGIQRMGGEQAIAKVLAFCAHARDNLNAREAAWRKAASPEDKEAAETDLLAAKFELLRIWQRFEAAGGIAEYVRLGGKQAEEPLDAYNMLLSLKAQEQANRDVRAMQTQEISKRQAAIIDTLVKSVEGELDKVRGAKLRAETRNSFETLRKLAAQDPNGAQAGLEKLLVYVQGQIVTEATAVKVHREELTAIGKTLQAAGPQLDVAALRKDFDLLDGMQDDDVIDNSDAVSKRRAKLLARADAVVNGAESRQGRYEARLQAVVTKMGALRSAAFYPVLDQYRGTIGRELAGFDYAWMDVRLPALEKIVDCALRAAAVREKLATKMNGHADAEKVGSYLAKVDGLFQQLTADKLPEQGAKINEPLQDAEFLAKKVT